jgi:hypothetical protein
LEGPCAKRSEMISFPFRLKRREMIFLRLYAKISYGRRPAETRQARMENSGGTRAIKSKCNYSGCTRDPLLWGRCTRSCYRFARR